MIGQVRQGGREKQQAGRFKVRLGLVEIEGKDIETKRQLCSPTSDGIII
jgi:hypothetical protein